MKRIILSALAMLGMVIPGFASGNEGAGVPARPVLSYQIRNVKYGDLLRPRNANAANGTQIVLYPAEPWKCMTWKLHPAGESVFKLQNHFTSKTIAVSTNGTAKVVQVPFQSAPDTGSRWQFTKLAGGSFEITDVDSGRALTAQKSSGDVIVILAPWQDSAEQKWDLIETDPAKLTM